MERTIAPKQSRLQPSETVRTLFTSALIRGLPSKTNEVEQTYTPIVIKQSQVERKGPAKTLCAEMLAPQQGKVRHRPSKRTPARESGRQIDGSPRPCIPISKLEKQNAEPEMTIRKTKHKMKSMGPLRVDRPCPEKFLKKHSKEPVLADTVTLPTRTRMTRKDPVPLRTDVPLLFHNNHNFVKAAIEQTFVTAKPPPARVDLKGHRELLENSGLVPKYVNKLCFGKLPQYRIKSDQENMKTKEVYDRCIRDMLEEEAMRYLNPEQRETILTGLWQIWHELNLKFRAISFVTDSLRKKEEKEGLESQLIKLEQDLLLLDSSNPIYIPSLPSSTHFVMTLFKIVQD